jgi:hypothetical protein
MAASKFLKLVRALFPGVRSRSYNLLKRLFISQNPNWKGVFAFPPGHFYSPLVDIKTLGSDSKSPPFDGEELWENVRLGAEEQKELLGKMVRMHRVPAWSRNQKPELRYYSGGGSFPLADAVLLSLVIQEFKPERILEVGGGFSTAAMLDTLDQVRGKTPIQVVEPYPDRLKRLIRPEDWRCIQLEEKPMQEVDPAKFWGLQANDILFIDSSHVAKIGSDVTLLLLKILPGLKKGVVVHFHDICYPETYPVEWVKNGWAWNESLMLRAFLIGNEAFRILAFNSYAGKKFRDILDHHYPALDADAGGHGGSLWLQKIS